jgi:hypothetical protein
MAPSESIEGCQLQIFRLVIRGQVAGSAFALTSGAMHMDESKIDINHFKGVEGLAMTTVLAGRPTVLGVNSASTVTRAAASR